MKRSCGQELVDRESDHESVILVGRRLELSAVEGASCGVCEPGGLFLLMLLLSLL